MFSGVLENTTSTSKRGGKTPTQNWTVSFIRKVSTVIVEVTHPRGQITQSGFLTAQERGPFDSKAEKTGAISRFCEYNNNKKYISKLPLIKC